VNGLLPQVVRPIAGSLSEPTGGADQCPAQFTCARLRVPWQLRGPSQRAPCARGGKDQARQRRLQSAPFGATRSLPPPPQWASVGVFHAFPFHGTRKRSLL